MHRFYKKLFTNHLDEYRQMLFVMGPRQVGKTTVALDIVKDWNNATYRNWDNVNDRELIVDGPSKIDTEVNMTLSKHKKHLIAFDEIHKYHQWGDFLKGMYDTYPNKYTYLVTGSAKLDVFNRGGDSLMGRYFPFRLHPLSVAEVLGCREEWVKEFASTPRQIKHIQFEALYKFGGYPDPFLKSSESFSLKWNRLRTQLLIDEEVKNLTRIIDIDRLELLMEKLKSPVGSLTSYLSLSKQLRVTDHTIRNWMNVIKSLYYCFEVKPWSKNITRSLLKEPKYYLWDWSSCKDEGMRAENMMASHLLKAVDLWNDLGLGEYGLHYIRDKDKREVDFLIVKNQKPWILIEVKSKDKKISSSLQHFNKVLKPDYAFQVVFEMDYVDIDCFNGNGAKVVPAKTFLSQLV